MIKQDEFKNRLRNIMDANGLRPCDVSRIAMIPRNTVSNYLSGRMIPSGKRLTFLAEKLDVSEQWLLGYDTPAWRTMPTGAGDIAIILHRLEADPEFLEKVKQML